MNEPKRRRATRREPVIDDFHGTPVADPYRWLENDTAPEVQAWIDGQNGDFEAYMAGIGGRDRLKERIKSLVHYTRCDAPAFVAGVYYVWRNDGLQNQAVLYRMKTLDDAGELVLDPNLLSTDGTVAISAVSFSPKGNFLAYGLSEGGSDWQTMKVLDLKTGQDRPDLLLHLKFSEASWLADESGFVYTRYPKPDEASVLERQTLNAMVFFHRLGTGQDADLLIHKDDEHPDWLFRAHSDEDKKWLFLTTDYGTLPRNRLHFRRLDRLADHPGDPWLAIADNFDEGWNVVGVIGDTAFIQTKKEAPFGRIVSVPLSESGAGEMTTVIPDRGEELDWAVIVGGRLLCAYLHDAVHRLFLHEPDGKPVREIPLPAPGSITGLSGRQNRDEFFLRFDSYLFPATVFRHGVASGESSVWFSPKIDFPFGDYETVQEFYRSKDGTRVPIFVTAAKNAPKDGNRPVLLYGYGGFTVSMTPTFSPILLAWLEAGGTYAVPCIRGGSEYGEAWHLAGILDKKQNVFDDFIAAAEHLIASGRTCRKKLAIMGGSNGGLLTAACMTQRPDLFGAVIVAVPVIDMLRYHLFTVGRLWTGEYGCAENPEQFPFMYRYSPLHNVRMNAVYPPTLIMTADTDDRVVPGQARKFAATLQAADAGDNPILIRIEKTAGHGGGKPLGKLIDERADLYAFLLSVLCMEK